MSKNTLAMKPKQATKRLLGALSERGRDVLTLRYGLGKNVERQTLEAIGQKYGITRERVRQIENHALQNIRHSSQYEKEKGSFDELERVIKSLGGLVVEQQLLEHLAKDESTQNQRTENHNDSQENLLGAQKNNGINEDSRRKCRPTNENSRTAALWYDSACRDRPWRDNPEGGCWG